MVNRKDDDGVGDYKDKARKEAIRKSYADYAASRKSGNKNDTDFEAFRQFHKEREERYRKSRIKAEAAQIKKNLVQWDDSVHNEYKKLSLKAMNTRSSKKLIKTLVANKTTRSVFLYSDTLKTRETLIYGLLRDYVNMGATSFSQVLHFTDSELTLWATTGFQGQNRFDSKIDNPYVNTIVVHGFTDKDYSEKELRLLENILSTCFYDNHTLIFSSGVQLGILEELLTDSGAALLRSLVERNIVNV